MPLRTGVDLIEVARIRRAVEQHGERFLDRIYTVRERADCEGRFPSLAARFAAKEAAAKALGTGIGRVRWVDIEVVCDENDCPSLVLHGEAATLAGEMGLTQWAVSLSHTHTHAAAVVVAMGAGA
jgi:holo-[acyl-carrier protein] synthase